MTNKLKFLQKMDELKDLGIKSGFQLSKKQVDDFFKPDLMNIEMACPKYLEEINTDYSASERKTISSEYDKKW